MKESKSKLRIIIQTNNLKRLLMKVSSYLMGLWFTTNQKRRYQRKKTNRKSKQIHILEGKFFQNIAEYWYAINPEVDKSKKN